jgi:hypothetical protein
MYNIAIVDKYSYQNSICLGLKVIAPVKEFPLLVGCSLKTESGIVIDLPAKWIESAGLAFWQVKFNELENPSQFRINRIPFENDKRGFIIFALWRDDSFKQRLADTGWVTWDAPFLIGSSTKSMDMQDENIRNKYESRFSVLSDKKPEIFIEKVEKNNDPLGIR